MVKKSRKEMVYDFLVIQYPNYVSPSLIGQTVFGPGYHSSTASPICKKLVESGLADRNEKGHYRAVKKD